MLKVKYCTHFSGIFVFLNQLQDEKNIFYGSYIILPYLNCDDDYISLFTPIKNKNKLNL